MRFPFLFNLMSKLGGIIACQVNADRVLESGELLGVYPEGIRGAFTMYKRAHHIGPSWRNDCVAFALRHRVPIVPFVTIGSAEIFPDRRPDRLGLVEEVDRMALHPGDQPVPASLQMAHAGPRADAHRA